MSQFNALTGYDSDSDDNNDEDNNSSGNFFSLNASSKDNLTAATSSRLQSEEISSSKSDPTLSTQSTINSDNSSSSNSVSGSDNKEEEIEQDEAFVELGAVNDAPLEFGSKDRLRAWSNSSHSFLTPVGPSGPVASYPSQYAVPSYQSSYAMPSNSLYNLANPAVKLISSLVSVFENILR